MMIEISQKRAHIKSLDIMKSIYSIFTSFVYNKFNKIDT